MGQIGKVKLSARMGDANNKGQNPISLFVQFESKVAGDRNESILDLDDELSWNLGVGSIYEFPNYQENHP